MSSLKIGMLAKSLAGHDRDGIYLIQRVDGECVYLVDGMLRRIDRPKRKNVKHIQSINRVYNIEEAQNEGIEKLIRDYKKEHSI